ncbi:cation:proton antiporter domain-containing protein [Nocardia sp. NPDC055053]
MAVDTAVAGAPSSRATPLAIVTAAVAFVLLLVVSLVWTRPAGAGPVLFAQLLLAVTVVIVSCRVAGRAAVELGQPRVIGEIAAGIALGPSLLGQLWPGAMDVLFPDPVRTPMSWLAHLGMLLFLFLAGMEIDPKLLRRSGRLTTTVSQVGFLVPLLLGALFAVFAYPRLAPPGVQLLPFALLVGAAMSVTALPVLVVILRGSPLRGTALAAIAVTSATVADVQAWILLALVAGLVGGVAGGLLPTVGLTLALMAGLMVLRPWLRALLNSQVIPLPMRVVILTACAVGFAELSALAGMHAAIGAFVFGLLVPRVGVVAERSIGLLGPAAAILLMPLFFAGSGMVTDLTKLGATGALWGWFAVALAVAFVGKYGGVALAARAAGASWPDSARLGALLNCRGMTELVVLGIGRELGLLGPELFTILVLTAFVCTAMTWPAVAVVDRFGHTGLLTSSR